MNEANQFRVHVTIIISWHYFGCSGLHAIPTVGGGGSNASLFLAFDQVIDKDMTYMQLQKINSKFYYSQGWIQNFWEGALKYEYGRMYACSLQSELHDSLGMAGGQC